MPTLLPRAWESDGFCSMNSTLCYLLYFWPTVPTLPPFMLYVWRQKWLVSEHACWACSAEITWNHNSYRPCIKITASHLVAFWTQNGFFSCLASFDNSLPVRFVHVVVCSSCWYILLFFTVSQWMCVPWFMYVSCSRWIVELLPVLS